VQLGAYRRPLRASHTKWHVIKHSPQTGTPSVGASPGDSTGRASKKYLELNPKAARSIAGSGRSSSSRRILRRCSSRRSPTRDPGISPSRAATSTCCSSGTGGQPVRRARPRSAEIGVSRLERHRGSLRIAKSGRDGQAPCRLQGLERLSEIPLVVFGLVELPKIVQSVSLHQVADE